ncbi:MAG: outer membrane beta-barrel protein [Ectothiorhodospiraceae bacterium]|nr:outer membrane beta-barrel protein [Ectothiorhodospiraceae bacterium]MCH8505172.1 porin family protein [Ectothiorhodospiraceae bacterium]
MKRVIGVIALLLPISVAAQQPDYSYVEGGLNIVDPPGRYGSSDTGVLVRGSYALDPNVFVRGGFSSHRFSTRRGGSRVTQDRDLLSAGVGFRFPTEQQALDLYGAADLLYDFGDADDAGFRLEGGGRAVLTPGLDSAAGLRYARLDSHDNVQIFVNSFYEVAPQLSLGGEIAVGDYDEITLGARYSF